MRYIFENFKKIGLIGAVKLIDLSSGILAYVLLLKVFEPIKLGQYFYYLAFFQLLVPVINFGLDVSGVLIVKKIHDSSLVRDFYVSSVIQRGGLVLVLLFLLSFFRFFLSDQLFILLVLSSWPLAWNIVFPVWVFQGLGKEVNLFFIALVSKIIYILSIILYINEGSSLYQVPLLNYVSVLFVFVMTMTSFKFVNGVKNIKIVNTFKEVKANKVFYLSQILVTSYTNFNKIIIGRFLNFDSVAIYDFVDKVYNMASQPIHVIIQAIFPSQINSENSSEKKRIIFFVLLISSFLVTIVLIFSGKIVSLIGGEGLNGINSSKYLKLYIPLLLITSVSSSVANIFLFTRYKMNGYRRAITSGVSLFFIFIFLFLFFRAYNLANHILILYLVEFTILIMILINANESFDSNIGSSKST